MSDATFVLVTSPDHAAQGRVGKVTHAATLAGDRVLVIELRSGVSHYVREGQYKIVKSRTAT